MIPNSDADGNVTTTASRLEVQANEEDTSSTSNSTTCCSCFEWLSQMSTTITSDGAALEPSPSHQEEAPVEKEALSLKVEEKAKTTPIASSVSSSSSPVNVPRAVPDDDSNIKNNIDYGVVQQQKIPVQQDQEQEKETPSSSCQAVSASTVHPNDDDENNNEKLDNNNIDTKHSNQTREIILQSPGKNESASSSSLNGVDDQASSSSSALVVSGKDQNVSLRGTIIASTSSPCHDESSSDDPIVEEGNKPDASSSHAHPRSEQVLVQSEEPLSPTDEDKEEEDPNRQQQQQQLATCRSSNTKSNSNSNINMKRTLAAKKLARKWLTSFRGSDPRWQLVKFFCEELCQQTQDKKLLALVEDATAERDRDEKKKDAAALVHNRASSISSLLSTTSTFTTASSVFTVWRPTSAVAIRRMIAGQATGKGLEIKGKSSKAGQLSGFVPFLQIHVEQHKRQVATIQKDGRVRVFYSNRAVRDAVVVQLEAVRDEMLQAVEEAKNVILKSIGQIFKGSARASGVGKAAAMFKKPIKKPSTTQHGDASSRDGGVVSDQQRQGMKLSRANSVHAVCSAHSKAEENDKMERELALRRLLLWDMIDPSIKAIDTYAAEQPQQSQPQHECYGIDMPNRLLWQAFVANADISRPKGTKHYTARPSQPAFQDLNWIAINKTHGGASDDHNTEQQPNDNKDDIRTASSKNDERRVVLWHMCRGSSNAHDENEDPMDPRCLVMAYEERERVLPVVSDFDCFTMGTRGFEYTNSSLPKDQVDLIKWCLKHVEGVLDKHEQQQEREVGASPNWTSQWLDVLKASAVKGFHPDVPKFGFGDVQSYKIMERAVSGLQETGAVRHGAECFNYYFPQELDDEFLIVSDALPDSRAAWQYVNVEQLQSFLIQKIDEGFTFPLNPKWILCDPGWKNIYNRLLSSQQLAVQDSLNVWFPPDSGIRELIDSISTRHPNGFVVSKQSDTCGRSYTGDDDISDDEVMGTEAMDLATLQLERYMTLRRAKAKIRAAMKFGHFHALLRQREHDAVTR